MLISICIITYKRKDYLKKLLLSLNEQENINYQDVEIIVVDNDIHCSAKNIVEEFKTISKFSVVYDIEPIQSIPRARNKTLELSNGEYLAFIDDDEIADKKWLINHYNATQKFNADACIGPLFPIYEGKISKWIEYGKYFYRIHNSNDGEKTDLFYIGNFFVNKKKLGNTKFDNSLCLIGGEDTELFHRLKKNIKLIVCNDAVVFEHVSANRANLKWLIQRHFRGGQSFVYIVKKKNLFLAMLYSIYGVFQIFFYPLLFLFLVSFNFTKAMKYFLKTFLVFGKIMAFFPWQYQEYKNR